MDIFLLISHDNISFLTEKIGEKPPKAGNPNAETVEAKLSDPANWFLPFRLK